jgi:hypothetical protein
MDHPSVAVLVLDYININFRKSGPGPLRYYGGGGGGARPAAAGPLPVREGALVVAVEQVLQVFLLHQEVLVQLILVVEAEVDQETLQLVVELVVQE